MNTFKMLIFHMTSIHDLHLIKRMLGIPLHFNSLVGILTSRELNYIGSADVVKSVFRHADHT